MTYQSFKEAYAQIPKKVRSVIISLSGLALFVFLAKLFPEMNFNEYIGAILTALGTFVMANINDELKK